MPVIYYRLLDNDKVIPIINQKENKNNIENIVKENIGGFINEYY